MKYVLPGVLPVHMRFYSALFVAVGYEIEMLDDTGPQVLEQGLKYVHNDACYPALVVIGQVIFALQSGRYDLGNTAVLLTQTGGGCRASNYLALLRKALAKAGFSQVPVCSVNALGMEDETSVQITLPLVRKLVVASVYGDLLMLLRHQTLPYENRPGQCDELVRQWTEEICQRLQRGKGLTRMALSRHLNEVVADFVAIPCTMTPKIKVGIVGEFYLKYHPGANNGLEDFLMGEGCEVMLPGVLSFLLCCVEDHIVNIQLYGGSEVKCRLIQGLLGYLQSLEGCMMEALAGTRYTANAHYGHLKAISKPLIGTGCNMGEGWTLTAEMLALIELGYDNIVCAQPFGCLPNHIVGKGMARKVLQQHPQANLVFVDYDPGACQVNQESRLRLMLAMARENARE